MLITRIPPSADELVRRALADTPFLKQIEGVAPHLVTTYAELAASLAAELWEAERHTLIAETLPPDLIAEVAQGLIAHVDNLRFQHEAVLYAAHVKVERAIAAIGTLQTALAGALPIAKAETEMDHAEEDLNRVHVALKRALDVLEREIDAIEWAKSAALQSSIGLV